MCAVISIRTYLTPVGLKNKGNTCFFNSTIQALLSLPVFINFIKKTEFDSRVQPILSSFKNFIFEYQNVKVYDPSVFIHDIRPKIRLFDGRQQDAHSFLESFLSILFDEQAKDTKLKELFDIFHEDTITCSSCKFSTTVKTSSAIQYLFIESTVQTSINNYCNKEEYVDEDSPWKCPKCNSSTAASIRHKIIDSGEYLIIHLNRFQDVFNKCNKSIIVDEQITFGGNVYENVGVVCHSGSLNGGHYYSKCKRDKEWYEFNDSTCTKTQKAIEGNSPYLLFYSLLK